MQKIAIKNSAPTQALLRGKNGEIVKFYESRFHTHFALSTISVFGMNERRASALAMDEVQSSVMGVNNGLKRFPRLIKAGARGWLSWSTIFYKAGYGADMSDILNSQRLRFRRKHLRSNPTTAERILWKKLSNKKFLGLKFRRQYSVGNYVVDFYCPQFKLAIELYGSVHGYKDKIKKDKQRIQAIEKQRIQVLVVGNQQVIESIDSVLQWIKDNLPPAPSFIRRGSGSADQIKFAKNNEHYSNNDNSNAKNCNKEFRSNTSIVERKKR